MTITLTNKKEILLLVTILLQSHHVLVTRITILMVILVHIKTVAQGNRAFGRSGPIGQVVLLHVVLDKVYKVELELEMTHVLKKVFKLKIVMVPVTPVVVHVNHGQNGVHAMLHVVPELKVEVVLVAPIKDVQMPVKRGHVMLV